MNSKMTYRRLLMYMYIFQRRYPIWIVLTLATVLIVRVCVELVIGTESGYTSKHEQTQTVSRDCMLAREESDDVTIAIRREMNASQDLHDSSVKGYRPNICNGCFEIKCSPLLSPTALCKDGPIKLMIFVTSSPNDKRARDAIRQSWASITKFNTRSVRYFFMVGITTNKHWLRYLRDEIEKHNDMVVYNLIDVYQNLTLKSVLGFKHVVGYCPNAEYVMKTDSDVFVNVPAILSLISNNTRFYGWNVSKLNASPTDHKRVLKKEAPIAICHSGDMFGLRHHNAKPNRNMSRKWYVDDEEYMDAVYPDYFDGHGYILSAKVVRRLVTVSRHVPFFRFEDVYIGLCLKHLGYKLTHTKGFMRWGPPLTDCSYKYNHTYSVHGVDPDRMLSIWNTACSHQGNIPIVFKDVPEKPRWTKIQITDFN